MVDGEKRLIAFYEDRVATANRRTEDIEERYGKLLIAARDLVDALLELRDVEGNDANAINQLGDNYGACQDALVEVVTALDCDPEEAAYLQIGQEVYPITLDDKLLFVDP